MDDGYGELTPALGPVGGWIAFATGALCTAAATGWYIFKRLL